jgi:hypothetical protein
MCSSAQTCILIAVVMASSQAFLLRTGLRGAQISVKSPFKRTVTFATTAKDAETAAASDELPFKMDDLTNLCKRKGFVFQSSEIYSPMAGFFDYGPLGVELKNNIKKLWWRDMVQRRDDVVGLDSSIIASPAIWQASGHIAGFSDPMVDCKQSKLRFRADQVFWGRLETLEGVEGCYVSIMESDTMVEDAFKVNIQIYVYVYLLYV